MRIRAKMVSIVVPLILAPLLLTGIVASLAARNGITRIATDFLRFKTDDLLNYAGSQWGLLVDNRLSDNPEFVAATKNAVASFARSLVRGDTELICALDSEARVVMATGELELEEAESRALAGLISGGVTGWRQLRIGGTERVGQIAVFAPFSWTLLVTEKRATFYRITSQIFLQTGIISLISLVLAVLLLLFFSYYVTHPLRAVAGAMQGIITSGDLSKRVEVLYRDETGDLGHSFNLMTGELDKATKLINDYALKAVMAKRTEERLRHIFEKYVPRTVIEQYIASPESMLTPGTEKICALVFSDIRGFTGISERMLPSEVVEMLNSYYQKMVQIIYGRGGLVDKYMGDGLLAYFGAPVRTPDDALNAVLSAFDMLDALAGFNEAQARLQRPPFRIGIGINYGVVTFGNLGADRKMDYTMIGDGVNLVSRLEGLTKKYQEHLLVSESVVRYLEGKHPCRLIDRVVVKGKTSGLGIYAPRQQLTPAEQEAWVLFDEAQRQYYGKEFAAAAEGFRKVQALVPQDKVAVMYLERCRKLQANPPPAGWTGVEVMTEK